MPHRYKITGLQDKNGQSNDCPFLYLDLFILSQNLLYKSNMKFYSIRQSRVVKMHVRIMETGLGIFSQSNEACFQFRLFFWVPEEVFTAGSSNGGIRACEPSSSLITSAIILVTSGVIMDAGVL